MATNRKKVGDKTTYQVINGQNMVSLQHAGGYKNVWLPAAEYDQLIAQGVSRADIATMARDAYGGQWENQTNAEASKAAKQYYAKQASKGGGLLGGGFGSLLKVGLPIAASFIPGIGPLASAGIGALSGALGGGGLKGAAIGAVTSGLGKALSSSLLTPSISGPANFGRVATGLSNSSGGFLSGINSLGKSLGSLLGGSGSSGLNVGRIATGVGSSSGGLLSNIGSSLGSALGNISGKDVLNAGANIYSGIQGTQAAKDIAKAQQASNDKALALQSKIYGQTSANLQPFLTSGTAANSRLSDLTGISGNTGAEGYGTLGKPFTPGDLTQDPGYQFKLQEGTNALNRSLGAQGSLFSGKALKAAQTFGQGLADTTYNDAFNRYQQQQQQQYNMLSGQAQNGQNAAALQGSTGQNYANQASALYGNQGQIKGDSIASQSNIFNQSLANVLGTSVGGFGGPTILLGYDGNGKPIYGRA